MKHNRHDRAFRSVVSLLCISLQLSALTGIGGSSAFAQVKQVKRSSPHSDLRLAPNQQTGLTEAQIKAIKADPKKGLEAVLGVPYDTLLEEIKGIGPLSEPKRHVRRSVKDAALKDRRYLRAAEDDAEATAPPAAPGAALGSSRGSPDSARRPSVGVGSILAVAPPPAAVVISNEGAETVSEVVLPRMMGVALEEHIAANSLETEMDPIFPDEQGNSVQSMHYARSSSSAPAPGVLQIRQGKTDLVYDRTDLTDKLWFDYNINLKDFAVDFPVNSETFSLSFRDPDEIRGELKLGKLIELDFNGKFNLSSRLEAFVIAGGVALTALLGWLNPLLGAFVLAVVGIVESLEGRWLPLDIRTDNAQVKSLVLEVEKTAENKILIRDVKSLQLDVGNIEVNGSDFTRFIDVVAKLFNGQISKALGMEGTAVENCTSLRDCGNDIAEIYFERGSLTANKEEKCWSVDEETGERKLKGNPKSLKCKLVKNINESFQKATRLDLSADGFRFSAAKHSAQVDEQDLGVLMDLDIQSVTARESCTTHLATYQPERFPVSGGANLYDLTPSGHVSVFLPLNALEASLHHKVLEGSYCSQLKQSSSSTSGAVTTQRKLALRPEGQFEIEPGFVTGSDLEDVTAAIAARAPAGALEASGLGERVGGVSRSAESLKLFSLSAPFSGELRQSMITAGVKKTTRVVFTAKVSTLGRISSDACEEKPSWKLDVMRGRVSDLRAQVYSPTGSVSECNNSSCEFYDALVSDANKMWKKAIAKLDDSELPILGEYDPAGLYVSLPEDGVGFVGDKALRLPVEFSTSHPCSDSSGGGSGGGSTGGGGGSGLPGDVPRPGLDDLFDLDDESDNDGRGVGDSGALQTREAF